MCQYPVHIIPKPLHYRSAVSSCSIDVPCGNCECCRDARKVSWEDRLCLEVSDWYKNGGIGLMLTFTYSPVFTPYYSDGVNTVKCFSPADVKQFLNRLKTRCVREFGNGFYKYFMCSEYGKKTQQPHYHTIFLIADGSKYVQFTEICRECWSLTFTTDKNGHKKLVHRLGFLFPKRKHGMYVDDKGRNRDPRFRSQLAGAKYVCKYICKDLAYMENDAVKPLLSDPLFKAFLPKSYKSNNLGFGPIYRILERGNKDEIQRMLRDGLWSPLQQKYVPLWQSAINKLMYDNVDNGRVNVLTGKKKYDRELSVFGREYLWYAFKMRNERTMQKMYERMLTYMSSKTLRDKFPFEFPKLFVRSDFSNFAFYHTFLRTFSRAQLASEYQKINFAGLDFFDVDTWRDMYIVRHDNKALSHLDYPLLLDAVFPYDALFQQFKDFDTFYSELCRYLESESLRKYKNFGETLEKVKYATGVYGFDEKLC